MEKKQTEKSIGTRYPLDILDALKRLAKQHQRSFNSEVIWALREYIQREEPMSKDAKKDL